MAGVFCFTTSGDMTIELEGLAFGKHLQDPETNIKSFSTHSSTIVLNAANMNQFTDWGKIELIDQNPGRGFITLTINSPTLGWYGTAQIALYVNGQCILNDNIQSGVRGPLGDPRVVKRYAIDFIGPLHR